MPVGRPGMERKEFLGRVRQAMSTADLPPVSEVAPGALLGDLGIANASSVHHRCLTISTGELRHEHDAQKAAQTAKGATEI